MRGMGCSMPKKQVFPQSDDCLVRLFAVLLGAALVWLVPCTTSRAMGSLPTGPSEKGNESEISASSSPSDLIPAQVRLLADRQFQAVLEQEIVAARSEIVLTQHLFTTGERDIRSRRLANLLAEAVKRGVKVIVVLEIGREASTITKTNRKSARYLQRRGVKVYGDMSGTTVHAKVAVIDRRLVFLGSHDFTEQSLGRYRETSVVVDSPTIATSMLGFVESLEPFIYREP